MHANMQEVEQMCMKANVNELGSPDLVQTEKEVKMGKHYIENVYSDI